MTCACVLRSLERFPRRGGNYNNGSNAGLGYVNSNNARGNGNWNYGVRPRSRLIYSAARLRIGGLLIAAFSWAAVSTGGVRFRPPGKAENKNPLGRRDGPGETPWRPREGLKTGGDAAPGISA